MQGWRKGSVVKTEVSSQHPHQATHFSGHLCTHVSIYLHRQRDIGIKTIVVLNRPSVKTT